MKGLITDIERFALHDGPGIRTTVFFKGCNMNCSWCHNPETIHPKQELILHPERCIHCYKCVFACPCKAQKRIDNEHCYYPKLCVTCGKCASVCYAQALEVSGCWMDIDAVMDQIQQDTAYYRSSGGGVTLSGGEVFCQPAFAEELMAACRAYDIPLAVETNLSHDWNTIAKLLHTTSLVICDMKLADSAVHKRWTGVGNERIRENIERLAASGLPFWVRTPLIPGVTDNEENISAIAAFLHHIDRGTLQRYELVNFNPLGSVKYKGLNRSNPFDGCRPLSAQRLNALACVAAAQGTPVKIS